MDSIIPPPDAADEWSADPRSVLTALSSAVYHWDILRDQIAWGGNAGAVLGVEDMQRFADGHAWRRLLSARSPAGRDEAIAGQTQRDDGAGVPFQARYEIVLPRGPLAIEDQGRWFAGVDGKPAVARGIIRVIAAAPTAQHDIGASTRNDLLRRIDQAMAATRQSGKPFALLTGCVRDYRAIDAEHGSEDADNVILTAMSRLQRGIRQTDFLARYATNRFALLLGRCPKDELDGAAARLSAIGCAAPIESTSGKFSIAMSWGGVADLDGATDARQVLRRCEEAMQQALSRGVGHVQYHQDGRRDMRRLSEQAVAEEVIAALNDRRVAIARQPIVDARTRQPQFEEALVRVRREDGDIIAAGAVIPLFEKLDRINLIDHRVLELAIQTLIDEPSATLSVNVSTASLTKEDWLATLSSAILGRADLADRLIVELTESQAIEDFEATRKMFSKLKAMGLRTAIDDFGAGYTSFRHLRGLDVDILKIDGAFVQNISRSADDSFFVRTLIDLARHLNIETVAEWVRDEESARKLASWGATYLQGDVIAPAAIRSAAWRSARAA